MSGSDVPTHYQAAILQELGSRYEIQDVEIPELEEDEVLVKVEAAGMSVQPCTAARAPSCSKHFFVSKGFAIPTSKLGAPKTQKPTFRQSDLSRAAMKESVGSSSSAVA